MQSVLITGATAGLGLRTARELARRGWHVVLGGRDAGRAVAALDAVRRAVPGGAVETLPLDLADLASVERAVEELGRTGVRPPLGALVGNAGIQVIEGVRRSADGYELTFATNHLGHHLLLGSLAPTMADGGRVVVVSSGTHLGPAESMGFPAPEWRPARQLADAASADPARRAGRVRYSTSKLANLYLTHELDRRTGPGITVNAYDPGLMPDTRLSRGYPAPVRLLYRAAAPLVSALVPGARTSSRSARYLADLVDHPRFAGVSGRYVAGAAQRSSSPESYDEQRARDLWADSDALVAEARARR